MNAYIPGNIEDIVKKSIELTPLDFERFCKLETRLEKKASTAGLSVLKPHWKLLQFHKGLKVPVHMLSEFVKQLLRVGEHYINMEYDYDNSSWFDFPMYFHPQWLFDRFNGLVFTPDFFANASKKDVKEAVRVYCDDFNSALDLFLYTMAQDYDRDLYFTASEWSFGNIDMKSVGDIYCYDKYSTYTIRNYIDERPVVKLTGSIPNVTDKKVNMCLVICPNITREEGYTRITHLNPVTIENPFGKDGSVVTRRGTKFIHTTCCEDPDSIDAFWQRYTKFYPAASSIEYTDPVLCQNVYTGNPECDHWGYTKIQYGVKRPGFDYPSSPRIDPDYFGLKCNPGSCEFEENPKKLHDCHVGTSFLIPKVYLTATSDGAGDQGEGPCEIPEKMMVYYQSTGIRYMPGSTVDAIDFVNSTYSVTINLNDTSRWEVYGSEYDYVKTGVLDHPRIKPGDDLSTDCCSLGGNVKISWDSFKSFNLFSTEKKDPEVVNFGGSPTCRKTTPASPSCSYSITLSGKLPDDTPVTVTGNLAYRKEVFKKPKSSYGGTSYFGVKYVLPTVNPHTFCNLDEDISKYVLPDDEIADLNNSVGGATLTKIEEPKFDGTISLAEATFHSDLKLYIVLQHPNDET